MERLGESEPIQPEPSPVLVEQAREDTLARVVTQPPAAEPPRAEPAPIPPPASLPAETRWPRAWPILAVLAVAAGALAYIALMPEPVPTRRAAMPSGTTPSAAPTTSAAMTYRLRLGLRVLPQDASITLDGDKLELGAGMERELTLACPRGHHELRVAAPGHRAVSKRLLCEGTVMLDMVLEAEP